MTARSKNIIVVPYDPEWTVLFEAQAQRIRAALGENCVDVHHVGSTAVPGLAAKPTLDIMIVVASRVEAREPLQELGFAYKGEINIPFRDYYTWRADPIHMNVHVVEPDSPELITILAFRDYLRTHDEMRERYGALKRELAEHPDAGVKKNKHLPQYTLGKDPLIREIMELIGVKACALRFCIHHNEWKQYHHLCRTRIFVRVYMEYDENHPNFTDPANTHFVLYYGAEIIGIAHTQSLAKPGEAAIRSIAVVPEHERQGHATFILKALEKWLKEQGVHTVRLHAAPEAVGFYKKYGYVEDYFDDVGINPDNIDMSKNI